MKLLKDLFLFIKAWRIAAVKMAHDSLARYRPETRHTIVYHQVIDELELAGKKSDEITGCIVHAAIGLCYRFTR